MHPLPARASLAAMAAWFPPHRSPCTRIPHSIEQAGSPGPIRRSAAAVLCAAPDVLRDPQAAQPDASHACNVHRAPDNKCRTRNRQQVT
jgi:hypothetical protein